MTKGEKKYKIEKIYCMEKDYERRDIVFIREEQ